jgi:hypothetical protein
VGSAATATRTLDRTAPHCTITATEHRAAEKAKKKSKEKASQSPHPHHRSTILVNTFIMFALILCSSLHLLVDVSVSEDGETASRSEKKTTNSSSRIRCSRPYPRAHCTALHCTVLHSRAFHPRCPTAIRFTATRHRRANRTSREADRCNGQQTTASHFIPLRSPCRCPH